MDNLNFDQLYQSLEGSVESLAKNSLHMYVNQAKKDGQHALENIKENLKRWAQEVETGAMNKEDLAFLLQSEQSLSEMISLKQAGLAAIQIDKFKNSLINLIIGTITSTIKI